MKVPFKEVPVGRVFKCNGNLCYKKSTRTASIVIGYDDNPFAGPTNGSWFYFGKNDICVI
jgi:hypothetical protein